MLLPLSLPAPPNHTRPMEAQSSCFFPRFASLLLLVCTMSVIHGQNTTAPRAPAAAPAAAAAPKIPQLFIIGDSTANNNANGGLGWGKPLADYFDPAKLEVLNRARAGRSSKTYMLEGLWDKVLAEMQPGDIVLLQFGHNDLGPLNDTKARGSLPGLGDDTKVVVLPNGQKQTVHTFGWYMDKYITDTEAKGAHPIVLTLTVRNNWTKGKVERGPGDYSVWSAAVAKSQHVPLIDLTTLIATKYEALGPDKVKAYFTPDKTHTTPAGAELNASLVVAGLKALATHPVNADLSAKGLAVPPAPASAVWTPLASNTTPSSSDRASPPPAAKPSTPAHS